MGRQVDDKDEDEVEDDEGAHGCGEDRVIGGGVKERGGVVEDMRSDLVHRGNRELLGTLFESMAVLGRPEEVAGVVQRCLGSECAALRDLMREVLAAEVAEVEKDEEMVAEERQPEVDVAFALTLLMAACSTNSIPQACAYIQEWQLRGFLPLGPCLYSLALEALAGSIGGTSQRLVCEQMPSLPFRGFLRVRDGRGEREPSLAMRGRRI